MVEEACERGVASVSVAHVVKRSGVSRRTFYEMFADREQCFAACFEQALGLAGERVLAAYDPRAPWRERIRAGLIALLRFLDEEPRLGRVLTVESFSGAPATVAARRTEVVQALIRVVEEGRLQAKRASGLPQLTGEGVVGAVLSVLQARLVDPERTPLVSLTGELMSAIVLPYLGAGAARRELERPTPVIERAAHGPHALSSDPFKDAGMRLTYRTVRVLMATGEHPGASNRTIGDTAEVADRAQISKLMNRLARIGLVDNTGVEPGRGGPNAWTLTPTGVQVVQSIRAHSQQDRGAVFAGPPVQANSIDGRNQT